MQRKYAILLALTLGIVALDQWTKYVTVRELTTLFTPHEALGDRLEAMFTKPPNADSPTRYHYRPRRAVTLVDKFLRFQYAENPGAAWGLFRELPENVRGPLFHLVSVGAVVLIVTYYRKLKGSDPTERWALYGAPLVLGGALGNYIDRIARGFVIDFIEAHWMDKAHFPSFNVADMAICVGVAMMIIDGYVRREEPEPGDVAVAKTSKEPAPPSASSPSDVQS